MQIGSQANAAALWFKTLEKNPAAELQTIVDTAATGKKEPVKSAAPNATFPTSLMGGLDVGSVMYLQQADAQPTVDVAESKPSKAVDDFLAYMKKTPEQRLREQILKAMDLTEEDLEGMPPEQRKAIEEKIAEIIKEKLTGVDQDALMRGEPPEQQSASLEDRMLQAMAGRIDPASGDQNARPKNT